MSISLEIGLNAITSYKRLAYTPWHAIAEFVDNSTQSYFNNRSTLDDEAGFQYPALTVLIDYDLDKDLLRVQDNAMGMSYTELKRALKVALPPENSDGRSKYGMGLKTAACWLGNYWVVRTKKLGETTEHQIIVDVDEVAKGNNTLPEAKLEGRSPKDHYTIIEISKLNRFLKGKTLAKIEQFLASMYREDFRNQVLRLVWRGKELSWTELDDQLLTAHDGKPYKKLFRFTVGDEEDLKRVHGWVGVLGKGSRRLAGFSILHSGRVVKGFPDSWRPATLYGQEQGSNDLVNQRLVGEVHLDDFEISHTKDDILWLGDQEEEVEIGLYEACKEFREVANTYRKTKDDMRGPTETETAVAINELQKELDSSELVDVLSLKPLLPKELVSEVVRSVKENVVTHYKEKFNATIDTLSIKGYIERDFSPNDPYVTIDATQKNEIIVIVNAAHPHWNQVEGSRGVLNYLRHCTYDGIAEWQARIKISTIDPDTIKLLKDKLLRIPLEIERHSD